MASGKKSFILYANLIETFEKLSDDKAGRLFKHILRYVNDLDPEPPDELTDLLFIPIRLQLKRDLVLWEEKRSNLVESGRIGGIKSGETRRKQNEANASNSKQNEANASNSKQNEAVFVDANVDANAIEDNTKTANSSPECLIPLTVDEFYPFDEFWNDYEKRVGDKTKLLKKWAKVPISERKLIKDFIPLYKESQPDKKFRKDPETFLNNKSWNDEIILNNTQTNGQNFTKQPNADRAGNERKAALMQFAEQACAGSR